MTLEKFIEKLIEIYSARNKDYEVVIPTIVAGTIGPSPSESVDSISVGFDWDHDKILIWPVKELTPVTKK